MNLNRLNHIQSEANDILTSLLNIKGYLEKKLLSSPPGHLHVIPHKYGPEYYLRLSNKDKSGTYMSKKNMDLVKQYDEKNYYEKAIKIVDKEIKRFTRFVDSDYNSGEKLKILHDSHTLISDPIDISDELYIQNWINQPYEALNYKEEDKKFTTKRGEKVRSKTERYIADLLYDLHIPYRYEPRVLLTNGDIMYPDFVILDVENRTEIIWEHFGMMSDPVYSTNTVKKLHQYTSNGYFVGYNLIVTTECTGYPITDEEIQGVVNRNILHKK